ncbi:MAG: tRNA pseudouridine(38-40) synthase TruA [Bacteroidota bacterium]
MQRYFLELAYKGTAYSGFQIQDTGATIQSALTGALSTIFRTEFQLTGSSRTDAGVHAAQNYFHFDTDFDITDKHIYNLNAVLPKDIAVKQISRVKPDAHCRFDALSRSYCYSIYRFKDPFLTDTAWLYPFAIDRAVLDQVAAIIMQYTDFTSFSKRNTQVKTFNCSIELSHWIERDGLLLYEVKSNRFLRGMIRGLVATMLKVARGSISVQDFRNIIEAKDCSMADFSAPAHGLCLTKVAFPALIFI